MFVKHLKTTHKSTNSGQPRIRVDSPSLTSHPLPHRQGGILLLRIRARHRTPKRSLAASLPQPGPSLERNPCSPGVGFTHHPTAGTQGLRVTKLATVRAHMGLHCHHPLSNEGVTDPSHGWMLHLNIKL